MFEYAGVIFKYTVMEVNMFLGNITHSVILKWSWLGHIEDETETSH